MNLNVDENNVTIYSESRDCCNNVIEYNLSDFFEFGTLVYPEEFLVAQNFKTFIKCKPRFDSIAYTDEAVNYRTSAQNSCVKDNNIVASAFEWRVLLQVKCAPRWKVEDDIDYADDDIGSPLNTDANALLDSISPETLFAEALAGKYTANLYCKNCKNRSDDTHDYPQVNISTTSTKIVNIQVLKTAGNVNFSPR